MKNQMNMEMNSRKKMKGWKMKNKGWKMMKKKD